MSQPPDLRADVRYLVRGDARSALMLQVAEKSLLRFSATQLFAVAVFAHDAAANAAQRQAFAAIAQDPSLQHLTTEQQEEAVLRSHRVGVALAAALELPCKVPYQATRHQLFVALGLFVLKAALLEEAGTAREMRLLDAAECIYAWEHLKPPGGVRVLWKQTLTAMLPELKLPNGKDMPAKPARLMFMERHPSFAAEADNLGTFGKTLSELRKAHESV